jgi:hypothetical protein
MNGRLIVLLDMNKLLDFRAITPSASPEPEGSSRRPDAKAAGATQSSR